MKYLKIQNNGELDIRLFSLMGGTTKSNDQFKIGQWGSGLKYSLAYLLKMNIDFKIFVGTSEIKIGTETESIRDEDFEIITVNGERTSITTNMGGNAWKPWTIVRELWCNALDEGGEVKETTSETMGIEGKTTFFIQITEEIREVIVNWGKYFIHELTPMFENENLELMNKQALTLLETCSYFIHPELQFCYGAFGDKRTLAKVNLDDKTIYISEQMKHQSLFQFVAMLIEENEHFNTGFEDETRQFQQHFINLFTKTLLKKNEIIL